ncbi:MAG: type IV pilus assembly protein PilW [Candidatus Azotimanducaceae bacterium]|jgi:type IV pilus assembly protein PilW
MALIARSQQAGFTIIEAMVGLTLSAIITLGITQVFVANSETYNLLVGQSAMQESGRFALIRLSRSLHSAGYKGCFSSTDEDVYTTFVPDVPYEFDLSRGVVGYEGETSGWNPNIETVLPKTVSGSDTNVYDANGTSAGNGINTDGILRGTDIITARHVGSKEHRLAISMPTSNEDVDTVTTDFGFGIDHMALIHDCEKGTIFRVTGFGGGSEVQHADTVDADGYTNSVARLAQFNTFETDAYVSAIETNTYYIAEATGKNNVGQRPMSLWVKSGVAAPAELVEGIEDLQIKYGVDTDSDDVPNRYVDADSIVNFADVVTLRLTVVATSVDDVGAQTTPTHGCLADSGRQYCRAGESIDGVLRRAFTQTVNLRNR